MPSPNASDDDESPLKRNKQTNTTPRRSPAFKRPNATPRRNVSGNKAITPKSAPARARSGSKKPEPTLLGDFLLGRPSIKKPRRRSLDVGKVEMREAVVNKVQPPGAVKDRIKQWQKASAAAVNEDPFVPSSEPGEVLMKADDETVDEDDRQRIKFRVKATRPGRRRSREKEEALAEPGRVKMSPKKRLVSDDHWMMKKDSSRTPEIKINGNSPFPKELLKKSGIDPSLERKLDDWAKRTTSDEWGPTERHHKPPANSSPKDDGIRIFPSRSPPVDHEIRASPSRQRPFDDAIRAKPVRIEGMRKVHENKDVLEDCETPKVQTSKHPRRTPEIEDTLKTRKSSRGAKAEEIPPPLWTTPSPPHRSRTRNEQSGSPESLAEIPVGYSAFSVLDIPVGADASAMRPTKPQRAASLSKVPKVLKMVYNEGLKIVHDTADPPRIGVNQPPSIESWLKGTSDPFVDQSDNPESVVQTTRPQNRRRAYQEDELKDSVIINEQGNEAISEAKTRHRMRTRLRREEQNTVMEEESATPEGSRTLSRNMVEEPPSQISPIGLRRSPATRSTMSPNKPARKPSFGEAFAEAFRGESESLKIKKPLNETGRMSERRKLEQERPTSATKVNSILQERGYQNDNAPDHSSLSPRGSDAYKTSPPQRRFARRDAPMTGQQRLSTIVSEPLTASPSMTETSSELSQTTATQTTVTQNTASTSHTSYNKDTESNISRQHSKHSGLKRRLTKHSDLLSILSLPDATVPGRSKSIRSARSVRTTRSNFATATMQNLLQELADDESKYMRELRTLVDGVIPVLLTCVLSKSEAAVAAGLFSPLGPEGPDVSITKPIVDMGIALERLKSLHRRIPLQDSHQLVQWATGAHKVYNDYLTAWRMGFQDVIVNLAPACISDEDQSLVNSGMPRNAAGDVMNEDGERVDVAFLLKRPLVRIKYLSKTMKGILKLNPSEVSSRASDQFQNLVELTRQRHKEEQARLEDQAANNTDTTRARDPKDLTSMEGVRIDRTRQVKAKDFFDLDIPHSNGQRIGCRVELLLRDKPKDDRDPGDILVCEVDHVSRWLLLPPLELNTVSARLSNDKRNLTVMIRGVQASNDWHEILLLTADSEETAREWVEMLGSIPPPPHVNGSKLHSTESLTPLSPIPTHHDSRESISSRRVNADNIEVPIGETRRQKGPSRQTNLPGIQSPSTPHLESLAGSEESRKYYSRQNSASPNDSKNRVPGFSSKQSDSLPIIPKQRQESLSVKGTSESPREKDLCTTSSSNKGYAPRDDGAPPPPAHKVSSNLTAKKAPILDSVVHRVNNRRSSSPLKHEYQPSDGSGTSSASEDSDSGDGMIDSESSDDENLEAPELPLPKAGTVAGFGGKAYPIGSLYGLPNESLAPSQSASHAPYREHDAEATASDIRLVASISCWSEKGHWKELWSQDCSIVIGPGIIEAFIMGASHSGSRDQNPMGLLGTSDINADIVAGAESPLVALDLTPCVPLRQSNALDIEIRSPPLPRSKLKCSHTVRFRSRTLQDCSTLYAAIHQSRMNNPKFKRLEQERILGAYGGQSYQAAIGGNRRSSWFGRRKSYRASTRAPSATVSDNSSSSFSSAIARLRNMGGSGGFNIAKSSIATHNGLETVSGSTSIYTSSSESVTSGLTPPRTPTNPSLALIGTSNVASLGRNNLRIRLYVLETSSKWNELGQAFLTVSEPPPGMRQASSLYHGIEKRILVTSDSKRSLAYRDRRSLARDGGASNVIIDQVLGGACFSRLGVIGIAMNVWEDIMGDNGEIGMVAAIGGVSGKTTKWMFQCATAKETAWIFSLVGGGSGGL